MDSNVNDKFNRHDLSGDLYINAFNTGRYNQKIAPNKLISSPPQDSGIQTIASSPEGLLNADHYIEDNGGTGNHIDGTGLKLNPRSCVICRKRKVRCDKREPCSNCVKANGVCVFPPPGRAPRKPRRPQDAELLKRLRRLESVVDSLGAQVDEDGHVHESESKRRSMSADILDDAESQSRRASVEVSLGRLVIKDGRSRYVANEFWSTLGEEISEMRNVLDCPSSGEEGENDDPSTPATADSSNPYPHHQGFMFGYASLMLNMAEFHPSPSQIFIIWEIFKENVDPVLKMLHVPTVKNIIMKAAVNASGLSRAGEAVFYSICFAAVISMTEDQCIQLLDQEKEKLLNKYRFAVEQSLSRAAFLSSNNLLVLQAFVLFISVVKYYDRSRSIWSLAGLAMSQAQAQGLHRDGTNFGLKPFETEMRRRLWWHISLQDARAAEDFGADPAFGQHFFDTRMPLNVNDDDIWPDMTEAPREQSGASDMTFCLVRFELAHMQRKLRIKASEESDEEKQETVKEKEQMIDALHQRMQERFFVHCDVNNPLLWVSLTVGKLILAKMWLLVHHPRSITDAEAQGHEMRERVFLTSVEVIDFGSTLEKGKHTAKWSWLFHTYSQWHAVAYVLTELCHRPPGPELDRAWTVIDGVYDKRMLDFPKAQRGLLWRPLKQLYTRAKKRREQLIESASPSSIIKRSMTPNSQDSLIPSTPDANWLGSNPYLDAVSRVGDASSLDFDDPIFNEVAMTNGFDPKGVVSDESQRHVQLLEPSLDAIPFDWTPGIADYFDEFGSLGQSNWVPQMQQEWH